MWISPYHCQAARDLLAMSQQELALASGVSEERIISFEKMGYTSAILPGISAIGFALERLGVVFKSHSDGVKWSPPYTESQIRVIKALTERKTPRMKSAGEVMAETQSSRADLEALAALRIVTGIDGYPMLTAMGLHVPRLLSDYEDIELFRKVNYCWTHYVISLENNVVTHRPSSAVFQIAEDGTLSMYIAGEIPEDDRDYAEAEAREALRLYKAGDPEMVFRTEAAHSNTYLDY
jgi:transcriptional regulator with XRE-family HTH domain